jgi:SAM-dependent methyltransferase
VSTTEGPTNPYDRIGTNYAERRRSDPRLERPLHEALGPGRLLNVGAGTGSYEPRDRPVVALESSAVMMAQRPASSAPAVQGRAEALPFADRSFEVVMAILTVHHWADRAAGLNELKRVAPRRVVLTFDPAVHGGMWLMDYLPEINELDRRRRSPSLDEVFDGIDGQAVVVLPVPWDCQDGMTVAYWRRPEAYLDHRNHAGGSGLRQIDDAALHRGLQRLERDLHDGRWRERYGQLLELEELDCGLRLVIGQAPTGE